MRPRVVGLGNDLLGDDAVGTIAARELQRELAGCAEVVETSLHGLALIDIFAGCERLIVIDAITTGRFSPGSIIELNPEDLESVPGPSPHFTGLPELIKIARELELDFPEEIRVIAVEVAPPRILGEKLSDSVGNALPEVKSRVRRLLRRWEEEDRTTRKMEALTV
jgi:hydrogenase maturation protease